jgi:hypothetical protein
MTLFKRRNTCYTIHIKKRNDRDEKRKKKVLSIFFKVYGIHSSKPTPCPSGNPFVKIRIQSTSHHIPRPPSVNNLKTPAAI